MRRLLLPLLIVFTACAGGISDGDLDDYDDQALTNDCSNEREVTCHESDNNCSYAAKRCDPVPRALDRVSRTPWFPLQSTGHLIEDSLGNPLGRTTPDVTRVKLNWGQRRIVNNTVKVLAFAVKTDAGTFSGWINESAIDRNLDWMPTIHAPDPGGSYSKWRVVPSNNNPYLDEQGNSLKVVETCDAGKNATDYLTRNGHANLIFNLPGYRSPALGSGTSDSVPAGAGLTFHRAQSQEALDRPLWSCASGRPVRTSRTLRFLYGYIDDDHRHGWMAEPNLTP